MSGLIVSCPDEADTIKVGEKIAGMVKDGGIIELVGDVGSGKTTFVKGLAKGLGYKGDISSPSFALRNIYDGRLRINHFDLYRLNDPGLARHELADAMSEDGSVVIIEWADSLKDVLPEKRIVITFRSGSEESRELNVNIPENSG